LKHTEDSSKHIIEETVRHTATCLLAGTRWNCRSISFPLASR